MSPKQQRKGEKEPVEQPDQKNTDAKPKDRLKDLDITDDDGKFVKGGVPKIPE
jgi:hypothetical protein